MTFSPSTTQTIKRNNNVKAFPVSFQLASGAFAHIKDTVLSALNREPTMDISPETVGTLSQIMLSQAQEVFVLKATAGASVFMFVHVLLVVDIVLNV